MAFWVRKHSFTTNLICGEIDCYSNCGINYGSNVPVDLEGFFGSSCEKCNHVLWNHNRCRATWGKVTNTQVSVDQTMKEWEAAEDETGRTAILDRVREQVLRELSWIINSVTTDLAGLVERYSHLSLSGSPGEHNVVRFLKQHYFTVERKAVDQDQLRRVIVSLGHMQRELGLLNNAKKNVMDKPLSRPDSLQSIFVNIFVGSLPA